MRADPLLLWPRPQRVEPGRGQLRLPSRLALEGAEAGDEAALATLESALARLGVATDPVSAPDAGEPVARLRISAGAAPPQGYRLEVDARGVTIEGADAAGLFYGACTLAQWLALHERPGDASGPPPIAALAVEDWPDLPRRGAMLDVSRDKVPTLETLFALVERLASWKLNQLQLYTEHTFAYAGHETVWRDASPLTAEEVRALDAHCRRLHVELVPNQNSFGHFHRWLVHEPYRALAEVPEGLEHPFNPERREPFSLCPLDPGSLALLEDLYDQLLPCFASRELNVGLDETFDLCRGRSAAACAERGKVRVYLDFLKEVHALVAARGHRMQFWGDIILEEPELIPELPPDAIALEWGYEADHPFAEHAGRFGASGLDFVVCPGTSSWCSFAGRAENALGNLSLAARAGRDAGAYGYLITDWGDYGHLQPLAVSWLGFLAGAGFAWNVATAAEGAAESDAERGRWAELLDRHVFADEAGRMGGAALELGNAYLHTGARQKNGTALFYLVAFPDHDLENRRYRGLDAGLLAATAERVERAVSALAEARPGASDGELARQELAWAGRLLAFACRLGIARLEAGATVPVSELSAAVRAALAAELAPLVAAHEPVWLARNRPGGRGDSASRLTRLLAMLAA